jgi:hypothetical protein
MPWKSNVAVTLSTPHTPEAVKLKLTVAVLLAPTVGIIWKFGVGPTTWPLGCNVTRTLLTALPVLLVTVKVIVTSSPGSTALLAGEQASVTNAGGPNADNCACATEAKPKPATSRIKATIMREVAPSSPLVFVVCLFMVLLVCLFMSVCGVAKFIEFFVVSEMMIADGSEIKPFASLALIPILPFFILV